MLSERAQNKKAGAYCLTGKQWCRKRTCDRLQARGLKLAGERAEINCGAGYFDFNTYFSTVNKRSIKKNCP